MLKSKKIIAVAGTVSAVAAAIVAVMEIPKIFQDNKPPSQTYQKANTTGAQIGTINGGTFNISPHGSYSEKRSAFSYAPLTEEEAISISGLLREVQTPPNICIGSNEHSVELSDSLFKLLKNDVRWKNVSFDWSEGDFGPVREGIKIYPDNTTTRAIKYAIEKGTKGRLTVEIIDRENLPTVFVGIGRKPY